MSWKILMVLELCGINEAKDSGTRKENCKFHTWEQKKENESFLDNDNKNKNIYLVS